MEPDRERLAKLARMLAATAPEELDCESALDRLAALLERSRTGERLDDELLRTKQHLSVCPECVEEFEALEELVRRGELEL
jgi:hypothetical protein